jgi:hypothetical protein
MFKRKKRNTKNRKAYTFIQILIDMACYVRVISYINITTN